MKVAVYEVREKNGTRWYYDGVCAPYVDNEADTTPLYNGVEVAKVLERIKELADNDTIPTHDLVEMIGLLCAVEMRKLKPTVTSYHSPEEIVEQYRMIAGFMPLDEVRKKIAHALFGAMDMMMAIESKEKIERMGEEHVLQLSTLMATRLGIDIESEKRLKAATELAQNVLVDLFRIGRDRTVKIIANRSMLVVEGGVMALSNHPITYARRVV